MYLGMRQRLCCLFVAPALAARRTAVHLLPHWRRPSQINLESRAPSQFITKLMGTLILARYTVNFAPMLAILCIGTRMRALQIDPKHGSPQRWAPVCF